MHQQGLKIKGGCHCEWKFVVFSAALGIVCSDEMNNLCLYIVCHDCLNLPASPCILPQDPRIDYSSFIRLPELPTF